MPTIAQQKIIHRFIRPISDYEPGGDHYYRVIPLDTQAYAIYPHGQREVDLYYVLGDGIHTYLEIKNGMGAVESAHEYPVISVEDIAGFMKRSHDPDTLYSVDSEGNTVNIPKSTFVFTSHEPSIIYATDENGNPTLLPVDGFGKVDDVLVDGTSVVTNKIANLGSMASESKDDYATVIALQEEQERAELAEETLDTTKLDKTDLTAIVYGTDESGDQALIPIDDLASVKLLLTNIQVLKNNWHERPAADGDSEFPYRYLIEHNAITQDMIPEVTFAEKEASSGLLSPSCLAIDKKLYIYSREVIDYNFIIPNIVFFTGKAQ